MVNNISNYHWLLSAGHGGIKNGAYTTAPSKEFTYAFTYPDAFSVYEGVTNRQLVKCLRKRLVEHNIDFTPVYDEIEDTPLLTRTNLANAIYAKDKRCIYLSVHCNSIFPNPGVGSGFEIYTSPGQTNSDKIAEIFAKTYKDFFPEFPFRQDVGDGDLDKEANLHELRETKCPALLTENLFFDNRVEAEYLLSEMGQKEIADCLLSCIKNVERLKPI